MNPPLRGSVLVPHRPAPRVAPAKEVLGSRNMGSRLILVTVRATRLTAASFATAEITALVARVSIEMYIYLDASAVVLSDRRPSGTRSASAVLFLLSADTRHRTSYLAE